MRRNKKHTPQNPRTKTAPAANTTTTTVTNTPTSTSSLPTSASSVQIFNNPEFGYVRVVMKDGEPWFVGKDVAEALGYERATKAIQDHVDFEDKDGVPIQDSIGRMQKTPIISESGLYSLILSSKLPSAKKFKRWVTSEVLPAIRKTGGYVDQSRSDLFIDTYLPFADEATRTLFKSTLDVINSQNEMIKNKNQEIIKKDGKILYQSNVINGLTKNIKTADMRQILNRIMRNNHGKFEKRWVVLYREFDNKYHMDTKARYENYIKKNPKSGLKNRLDFIDKYLIMLPELFDVATKLFESDVKELVNEMYILRTDDNPDGWMAEL